jgi:hypothetical protein
MSNFSILDLVIGMVFIYFLLSVVCSSVVELWFTLLRTRARLLEEWLKQIFNQQARNSDGSLATDPNGNPITVGQAIMDHCMVTALSGPGKSNAYIAANNFFSALIDKITIVPVAATNPPAANLTVQTPPTSLADYIIAIKGSDALSGELKRTFLLFANEAKDAAAALNNIAGNTNFTGTITNDIKSELDHFREKVEKWYDTNAERLTGKLKRSKAMPSTLIFAAVITVWLNADSVSIGKYLYDHKTEAKEFADKAIASIDNFKDRVETMRSLPDKEATLDTVTIDKINSSIALLKKDVDAMKVLVPADLPFGWEKEKKGEWDKHIVGWLVTILAISVGAPFWFDLLNKIANIRGSGPKPVVKDTEEKK